MTLSQFVSLLPTFPILLALMAAGYWRWVRPQPSLGWQARGLLLLILLTPVGGFFGAFFWWLGVPGTFSWALPPLAGRMLAAAGWSFAVLCVMTLGWPSPRRVRLTLAMLLVYLAPLAAAIVLFHRDRFDWGAPITYAFLFIVALMIGATSYYLIRQPIIFAVADDPQPTSNLVRKWLALVGGIGLVWGIALFVTDDGGSPLIWAWPGDLLSSRLIAVMLLAVAAGCALSYRKAGPAQAMLAATLTYGLGLAAAGLWSLTGGKPAPYSYVGVFGAIGIGSAALLVVERFRANRVQ